MKSFYSILYCNTRPNIGEQVGVGLIVYVHNKVYFKFSEEKIRATKDLLSNNAFQLFKNTVYSISHYINNISFNKSESLYEHPFINEKYFNYLHSYSNNLLKFSQPKELIIEESKFSIDKLFKLYIYELDDLVATAESSVDFVRKVKKKYNSKIQNFVNLECKLDHTIIPHLAIPTNVWFVGKNEHKVVGDVIDCTKDESSLSNRLRSVIYVKEQLFKEDDQSKIYVIHNLSHKNDSSILELVQKEYSSIDFLHETKFDAVPKYLTDHNVKKII